MYGWTCAVTAEAAIATAMARTVIILRRVRMVFRACMLHWTPQRQIGKRDRQLRCIRHPQPARRLSIVLAGPRAVRCTALACLLLEVGKRIWMTQTDDGLNQKRPAGAGLLSRNEGSG